MGTIKKQYYGIKFPFTDRNMEGFFVDLNSTIQDKVASEIAHVILTPKGTRLRRPEFGTDILKFIFEPNDEMSWEEVKSEIVSNVNKFVNNTELVNINIVKDEKEDNAIFLALEYKVRKGNREESNKTVIRL